MEERWQSLSLFTKKKDLGSVQLERPSLSFSGMEEALSVEIRLDWPLTTVTTEPVFRDVPTDFNVGVYLWWPQRAPSRILNEFNPPQFLICVYDLNPRRDNEKCWPKHTSISEVYAAVKEANCRHPSQLSNVQETAHAWQASQSNWLAQRNAKCFWKWVFWTTSGLSHPLHLRQWPKTLLGHSFQLEMNVLFRCLE